MVGIGFDRALAIAGFILAILLVVLDKAGKLRGPVLFCLLAIAAAMTLPLVFSIPWVAEKTGAELFARCTLMVSVVGVLYSLLCVWISGDVLHPNEEPTASRSPASSAPVPSPSTSGGDAPTGSKPDHSHKSIGAPSPPSSTVPRQTPLPQIISAPNGIAIGGGTVTNPTVNNYGPPQRQLTKDERDRFVAYLRPLCPFEVVIRGIPGNAESMEYADQIAAAITDAGCTRGRTPFLIDTAASYGIQIAIHDINDIPPAADALAGAFTEAGIKFSSVAGDPVKPKEVNVMVNLNGSKPQ